MTDKISNAYQANINRLACLDIPAFPPTSRHSRMLLAGIYSAPGFQAQARKVKMDSRLPHSGMTVLG
ncbi:hypothetical protein ACLUEY_05430 [Vreelandella aquamarina]